MKILEGGEKVHPSKFFKMAEILNCNGVPDRILKQKLENVHPLNFLNAQIKLPVYKVGIRYRTRRGNLKETEKYMLAGINPGGGVKQTMKIFINA